MTRHEDRGSSRMCVSLCALLAMTSMACSSEPNDSTTYPFEMTPSGAGMGGDDVASTAGQDGNQDPASGAAGTGASPSGSAGSQAEPSSEPSPSDADPAGDDRAGEDPAGEDPAGEDPAGEDPAQEPSEPIGPLDYGAPGPHEVVIEENVGESHRNGGLADDSARCESFLALVGSGDEDVEDSLTSYPEDMDRQLYTLYRPAELKEGATYPVITWGNGTCAHPLLYEELLGHLASHGFIVIATNWRWVGGGVEMQRALDFVIAENENPGSALFGKVATDMLGASGHSQGSGATITVGASERIVATVPIQGAQAAGVRALSGPTFLIAGELDTLVTPQGVESAFRAATVPAVYGLSVGQDHLMPGRMPQPILEAVTGWFRIHLAGDEDARSLFYEECTLCDDPTWRIDSANL